MAYTTNVLVLDVLGAFVDTTNDLTTAEIDAHIARVDGKINDRLGGLFFPFNATGSTPDTPDTIKEISRHWSIAESLRQLVGTNNQGAMNLAEKHEGIALNLLDFILQDPDTWMKPETKSAEAVTFGAAPTYSWQLAENEVFLANTSPLDSGDPPNILADTVRIAAATGVTDPTLMRNDASDGEFHVEFRRERRKWVLVAHDSTLYDATGVTVTYEWNYRRIIGSESIQSAHLVSQFA